jgi:hypothetical protein
MPIKTRVLDKHSPSCAVVNIWNVSVAVLYLSRSWEPHIWCLSSTGPHGLTYSAAPAPWYFLDTPTLVLASPLLPAGPIPNPTLHHSLPSVLIHSVFLRLAVCFDMQLITLILLREFFLPRRRRRHFLPKHQFSQYRNGGTSQKTTLFKLTVIVICINRIRWNLRVVYSETSTRRVCRAGGGGGWIRESDGCGETIHLRTTDRGCAVNENSK